MSALHSLLSRVTEMSLSAVTGVVSGLRHSVSEARPVVERVGIHEVFTFRLGDRSAQMRIRSMPDVQDGDRVTVAGREKQGVFHILAMRNEETGIIWSNPSTLNLIIGPILVILGLPLCVLLIGFLIVPVGGVVFYQGVQLRSAAEMLRNAPIDSGTVTRTP